MSSGDFQKVLSIIKDNSLHTFFATCDGDQPRVRSITAIVENDMSIWIATGSRSRKVQQIRQNPKVCLAFVEQPDGTKSAIVIGEARIVSDVEEKKRIWNLASFNMLDYFPDGPASDSFCLLKIVITKIEWWASMEDGLRVYEPV